VAAAGIAAAALSSAIVTGLSGGNLGQILRAGAIAGATAFAFFEVGGLTNQIAGQDFWADHFQPQFGSPAYDFNVAAHALVGCASSAASGGSCESGALSGGVSAAAGPLINGQNFERSLVANAVVGGVASVAGGGKFANGALTGAFGYLFNAAGGVGRMLMGQEAHTLLQDWLVGLDIPGLFTETSYDNNGTSFWGRVDIGNSISREIWEIKPDSLANLFLARVMAEFYSITANVPATETQYGPGGLDLPLPAAPLRGGYGSYTYGNAGEGATLWNRYTTASQGYSFSPDSNPLPMPPPISNFLFH
jgi:hypothetical protein